MLTRFFPDLYVDSIFHIPYEELKARQFAGLVFDIDNTLAPYDTPLPPQEVLGLFDSLQKTGFKICFLSNNKEARVAGFNINLQLPAVSHARKPGVKGIHKALKLLQTHPGNTALIGDQVFTDVWCGNRLGLLTVLVKPLSDRDEFTVKLKRGVEKIMLNHYLRRVHKNDSKSCDPK